MNPFDSVSTWVTSNHYGRVGNGRMTGGDVDRRRCTHQECHTMDLVVVEDRWVWRTKSLRP